MKRVTQLSAATLLLAIGCSDGSNEEVDAPSYLDTGVSVPEEAIVTAIPKPTDTGEEVLGTNPVPELNQADDESLPQEFLQRRTGDGTDAPQTPPGTGDRGFWINAGDGVYARNDLQDNLTIPNSAVGTTIYAPTHMSGGGACIETVMAHWRPNAASATLHGHGFWDWCRATPGWGLFENINAAWKTKYARSDGSENMYYTQVYKTSGNCWVGQLWNYSTGVWDTKLTSCGTTKTGFGTTGWTMWESWGLTGCPTFPRIKSNTIKIRNGSWVNLGAAHSSVLGPSASSCFSAGSYTFAVLSANYAWEGRTP
jgi:hypothetical protein